MLLALNRKMYYRLVIGNEGSVLIPENGKYKNTALKKIQVCQPREIRNTGLSRGKKLYTPKNVRASAKVFFYLTMNSGEGYIVIALNSIGECCLLV